MHTQSYHPYGLSCSAGMTNTASGLLISTIANYITPAPTVYNTQTCKETLRVLFSYPESKCIVVIDQDHRPVGLVMNNRFYLQMLSSTRIEDLYQQSITRMMNHSSLVVDIHSSIDTVKEEIAKLTGIKQNDCVIVTENDKLTGVINITEGLLPKQFD